MLQYGDYQINPYDEQEKSTEDDKIYVTQYILIEFKDENLFSNPNYALILKHTKKL